jgi:cobalamin biosynthesis Mg chelatase CobN
MVLSKQYLPCLTFVLGILGVVVCVAGLAGVWSLGSRLTQTSDKVFERIDETLAAVQDRFAGVQERVRESKITAEDIDQSLKNWTKKETRQRLASRLEVEKKAEQLVLGLRQADRWLEISGVSIQGIQQGLQLGSSLGAPVDVTLVDPWLERLGSLRSQLERSTETVSGIRDHAAEITAGDSREERVRQAIQLTLRVAVTLGEIDSRLGETADRLAEMQSRAQQQQSKTHRRIMTAIIGALLLITWMGAGQVSLCLHGWRAYA